MGADEVVMSPQSRMPRSGSTEYGPVRGADRRRRCCRTRATGPGVRVERVEIRTWRRDVDDRPSVDPRERHALAVVLPRRGRPPRIVLLAEHPQRLARRGLDADHGAAEAGHGVELAVDVERRRAINQIRLRTVVGGRPAPQDLHLAEVRGVDLIERRVAGAPFVGSPVAPAAVFPGVLRGVERGRCSGPRRPREPRFSWRSSSRVFSSFGMDAESATGAEEARSRRATMSREWAVRAVGR